MTDTIENLARQAGQAANTGRWQEAERLWTEVRRLDPKHAGALFSLGVHATQRRDFAKAATLLEAARASAPRDLLTLLTLGRVRRELGDANGELETIDAALAVDPYFLPALLARGAWLERAGATPTAAHYYRTAVRISPPEAQWPDMLRSQLVHARDFARRQGETFNAWLEKELAPYAAALPPELQERWREASSIKAGLTQPYHQESNQLHVPRLPAVPFYDRSLFPWAATLEAKTDVIRAELKAALEKHSGEFSPYIALRPGQPVDQWAPLNHSTRWSHYRLWRNGQPDEAHLAECPETRKSLEAVDMARIDGLCPNVMFSALEPHTQIPPHHGETNARLVAHLPLIVPPNCTYRVGFEQREWREGELLVFDDTIEHEARNDSDELRVVLIFDIWNPHLSLAERDMVRAMATATRAFESHPGR